MVAELLNPVAVARYKARYETGDRIKANVMQAFIRRPPKRYIRHVSHDAEPLPGKDLEPSALLADAINLDEIPF